MILYVSKIKRLKIDAMEILKIKFYKPKNCFNDVNVKHNFNILQ